MGPLARIPGPHDGLGYVSGYQGREPDGDPHNADPSKKDDYDAPSDKYARR